MKKVMLIVLAFLPGLNLFGQSVGIGTTTPRLDLEVSGVAGIGKTIAIFGGDGAGISLQANWPSIGFNQYRDQSAGNGKYMANGYAAVWYFDKSIGSFGLDMLGTGNANTTTANGFRALTLTNTGNVGIQTAVANASLTVLKGNGLDGTAVFGGVSNASYFNYSTSENTYIRSGTTSGSVDFNWIPNGKVLLGYGFTSVAHGWDGPATATWHQTRNAAGAQFELYNLSWQFWGQHYSFASGGWDLEWKYGLAHRGIFTYSTGTYYHSSDRRLKEHIESMPEVLPLVQQLRPVSYIMRDHNPTQKRSIGFIAQEVKEVFPELVNVIDNNARKGVHYKDLHTMNYSGMNVIAIKALQEQSAQLQELEKEQHELLNEIKAMKLQ